MHAIFCSGCGFRLRGKVAVPGLGTLWNRIPSSIALRIDLERKDRLVAAAGGLLALTGSLVPWVSFQQATQAASELKLPDRPAGLLYWMLVLAVLVISLIPLFPQLERYERYLLRWRDALGGLLVGVALTVAGVVGAVNTGVSRIPMIGEMVGKGLLSMEFGMIAVGLGGLALLVAGSLHREAR
ncbi:MAG: hypothetical protein ACOY94_22375 [Bacillota bacterium]